MASSMQTNMMMAQVPWKERNKTLSTGIKKLQKAMVKSDKKRAKFALFIYDRQNVRKFHICENHKEKKHDKIITVRKRKGYGEADGIF